MYLRDKNEKIQTPPFAIALFALAGLLAGFILTRVIITPFYVADDSMLPGLQKGDLVFVLKWGSARLGDCVLFSSPLEPGRVLLKRVIAVGGDSVEIVGKAIYRNGSRLSIPWKTVSSDRRIFPMSFTGRDNYPMVKLGRNEYFVIGDNIDRSMDSRSFGPIRAGSIIGTVLYRW